ncbi:DUF5828 family protein [Salinigranum marinum]|uniref:DUF5828 family protein n=1 Tax=Salinigranum marinum TaxID=1515595 RepID=UPI0029899F59|nr:DUF5828 family protein [Salinigranum marinum]
MEERVSGFRVRGSWEEVVAHGERIARALRESDVDAVALDEWEDWRPKAHEELGEEVSEKTVAQARIKESAGEEAGQAAREDLERASEHALESIEKVEGDGPEDVLEKWEDALEHGLRAVDTTTRKAIRTIETAVYEQIMTRFTPYYLDNDLVSANIRETARLENGDEFVFEVDVNDDQLKQEVSQRLDRSNGTGQESL